ncbi:MAG: ORF6N domain-containing protein [Nanoarchaeota archaeon]|nr:ORF6N domain-containing protein [Nanoarchaeota archaeon]MBU1270091.1 ORF6N domain-containing protein [Nanoarchaeota archaeon]MBU1603913.1 ORF6N domain-containing protein [Nanoarchaeota archaeon]MBU2443427.1 ORF6N domain-containing protein [Nanoarchaeota archaeon]
MLPEEKINLVENQDESIKKRIFTIRGFQVMLDRDLAELYEVPTNALNQAVKRNIERFPNNFMFQLTNSEYRSLRSQIVTLETGKGKHRKYLPYVFTEQGVSMLSGILRSPTAIKVSIQIMNAFVAMRKFIVSNAQIFQRLNRVELKQLEYDNKFEKVFEAIESKELVKKQGIFYDGQIFDAYKFVSDLIKEANKSIILIDNYVDDTVLTLFLKRKKDVKVIIYTKKVTENLKLDLKKFNSQYEPILIKEFDNSHDRFMIIDDKEVYHFGASLKDLGKKWFAFSKFDKKAFEMMEKLKEC